MKLQDVRTLYAHHVPRLLNGRGEFAVLVPLVERPEGLCILYEVRAEGIRQPREVCFPGGKMEVGEDAIACALRETWEELGIEARHIEVLGRLDFLHLRSEGLMHPVLAHVERCIYFRKEPERLMDLVQMGTLAQVSARAIASRKDQRFAKACLLNGLAHIIASDAHDMDSRNPCLATATEDLECLAHAENFAQAVWKNEMAPVFSMTTIKKTIFGYK